MEPNEKLLELGRRVAELSVPYAHALAAYDENQTLENARAIDRALYRWRRAVEEMDNFEAALKAIEDGIVDPGF